MEFNAGSIGVQPLMALPSALNYQSLAQRKRNIAVASGAFVVPGRRKDSILSNMSLTTVARHMGRGDITVHGFRSTFRDWCVEAVGNAFACEVCEHALVHSLASKVEAAYLRGELFDKSVPLVQAWAD